MAALWKAMKTAPDVTSYSLLMLQLLWTTCLQVELDLQKIQRAVRARGSLAVHFVFFCLQELDEELVCKVVHFDELSQS